MSDDERILKVSVWQSNWQERGTVTGS